MRAPNSSFQQNGCCHLLSEEMTAVILVVCITKETDQILIKITLSSNMYFILRLCTAFPPHYKNPNKHGNKNIGTSELFLSHHPPPLLLSKTRQRITLAGFKTLSSTHSPDPLLFYPFLKLEILFQRVRFRLILLSHRILQGQNEGPCFEL